MGRLDNPAAHAPELGGEVRVSACMLQALHCRVCYTLKAAVVMGGSEISARPTLLIQWDTYLFGWHAISQVRGATKFMLRHFMAIV